MSNITLTALNPPIKKISSHNGRSNGSRVNDYERFKRKMMDALNTGGSEGTMLFNNFKNAISKTGKTVLS